VGRRTAKKGFLANKKEKITTVCYVHEREIKHAMLGHFYLLLWWAFGTSPGRAIPRDGLRCFWSINFCEMYSGVPVLTGPRPGL
jgi:hypothetical protein